MTQETICPACGAPLVITSQEQDVHCTFCGADLHIDGEGGQAAFRVVNQPEPQKETLSKPVEGHGDVTTGARVYAKSGMGAGSATEGEGPVRTAMGYNSTDPSFQPEVVSSGAAVYPASPERKGLSGANRWFVIGGAALLGLFLLCACLAVVVMAVLRNSNF